MSFLGRLLGTPPEHKEEKKENAVVTIPEFDITQYAKKLAVVIGVLAPAIAGVLKALKVEHVSSGMVIGAFGVTAAALLGVSLVMAVDIASRAFLTVSKTAADSGDDAKAKKDGGSGKAEVVSAPSGAVVWLEGDEDPHPVLAIAGDGTSASSYLVAAGPTVEREAGSKSVAALDGPPQWHPAEKVRAVRPRKWP